MEGNPIFSPFFSGNDALSKENKQTNKHVNNKRAQSKQRKRGFLMMMMCGCLLLESYIYLFIYLYIYKVLQAQMGA